MATSNIISESLLVGCMKFFALVYKIIIVYIDVCSNVFKKPQKKSIKGQNVLITGSGHGLGREMAIKFATNHEVNLVLIDINETNNERVKEDISKILARKQKTTSNQQQQQKILTYSVDIRDESEVAKLASRVSKDLGDIDILINNAGIVQCLPFLELSPALVERTFQVNTLAHIWTIKHFLPSMLKNKRGHIVAISSIAGLIGGRYITDYSASKFAVVGLMESLEKEIHHGGANENVHLTTICPSSMSTGMFQTFTSRFSWLLPVLKADQVAEQIVESILTNKTFIAIPQITLIMHRLSSIIPTKVNYLVQDYLNYGVKPHIN